VQPHSLRNLIDTFCTFGKSAGGQVEPYPNFVICHGQWSHPISNFAICITPDAHDVAQIARHAAQREFFHLYAVDGSPKHDILEQVGFNLNHRLHHLSRAKAAYHEFPNENSLFQPTADVDRKDAVSLMIKCFFQRYSLNQRRLIQSALVASEIPVVGIYDGTSLVATAFANLIDSEAGVYNLCVEPESRRRGLGKQLINFIARHEYCDRVTLQSDSHTQNWYKSQGFAPEMSISVYTFNHRNRSFVL
jgi:ribosomal protein S18 acetylase RimI-like enzyme